MVGVKIGIDESSKKDLFAQIKEIFAEIESHKIELGLDTKILDQIKDVKSAIDTLEQQKNIELNLKGLEKIQNDFKSANTAITSFKEQLKSISNSDDITIKINDDQAIATIKTLEGRIEKVNFDVNRDQDTNIIQGFTLDKSEPVQSFTDKSSQQELKESIKEQNDLYKDTQTLLKQIYQLDNAIDDAQQKGMTRTQQQLELMKQQKENTFNNNWDNLNSDNQLKLQQQANELINNKNLNEAKYQDKIEAENVQIQKQIELYKQDVDSRLKNLQTQSKDEVFNNSDVQAYVEQINKLKNSLNTTNFPEVKAQISSAFKGAGATVRDLNSEVSKTHGLFGNLLEDSKKMATWAVSGGILFGLVNSFKDGIKSSMDMDSTLATLQITMNSTSQGLQQMKQSIQQTAVATSSSIDQVSEAAKIYANMNESMQSIMAKSKSAIMLSNVSGLNTKDTTDSIHAIINEFDLANKDVATTSTHIADSLVNISANMAMDFGSGIDQITRGIQVVGNVAKNTGKMSVEQTEATIGAIVEKTRLGGEQVGNALRTIMARVYQSKSVDPDVSDEDMSKTSKMLSQLGVSVKDETTDSFKSFSTILQEVSDKEKNMSDSSKSAINEQMAGIRQVNILSSALQSMNKIQDLTNKGVNSNNALQDANNKHMDTAAAKWKQFGAEMQSTGNNFISTGLIKGVLDLLNSLGGTLVMLTSDYKGAGIAVGILTAAFIACSVAIKTMGLAEFETKMVTIPRSILNVIKSIQSLDDVLAIAQFAGEGLMKVLIMNPLTWIGVAIGGIVSLIDYEKQLDDLGKDVQSTMTSLHKSMQNQDSSGIQSGIEKIKEWQNELDKAKNKADEWSSGLKGLLGGGTIGVGYRTAYEDKLNEIEKKSKDQTGENIKINDNGKIDDSKYEKEAKSLKQLQNVTNELSDATDTQTSKTAKLIQQYISLNSNTDKTKSQQKEQASVVSQLQRTFGDLSASVDKQGNVTIKNINTLKSHADSLNNDAQSAEKDKQEQDNLTSTLNDSIAKIKDYSKYIKDMDANTGHLSATDAKDILKNHTELLPYLNDEATLYKKIKEAINDEQKTADNAYSSLLKNNNEYYKNNTKLKNAINSYIDNVYSKYKSFFTTKADAMKKDVDNAQNAAQAELKIETDLVKAKAQAEKAYYDAKAKADQAMGGAELQAWSNPLQVASGLANGKSVESQIKNNTNVKEANDKANQAKQKLDEVSNALADAQKGFDDIINSSTKLPDTLDETNEGEEKTSTAEKNQKAAEEAAKKATEAQEKQLEGQVKNIERQKKAYDENAEASYKAEKQQEDNIIKGYQTQLDQLQKKNELEQQTNELLKDQNDIIKAQQNLNNVQQEKNVRLYENGQWVWTSDQQKLDSAEEALVNAQNTLREKNADVAEKRQEDDLNSKIKAEEAKRDAYEQSYQNAKDAADKNFQDQEDALNERKESLQGYDSGTDDADEGVKHVGESSIEIIIGNQLRNFQGGEQVLNGEKTQKVFNNIKSNNITNSSNNPNNFNDLPNKNINVGVNTSSKTETNNNVKQLENNIGQSVTTNKKLVRNPITNLKDEIINEIQQFINGSGQYSRDTNKNIGTAIDTSKLSVINPTKSVISNVKDLINNFVKNEYNDGKELNNQIGKGITDSEADLMKVIDDVCQKIIDEFKKDLGIHSPSTVAHQLGIYFMQGFINGLNESDIESMIADKMTGMVGAMQVNLPGDVDDWIKQALSIVGAPDSWLSVLKLIVSKESGGDPNEINSTPVGSEHAIGLMQTLPSTFQEYMMSGHNNILNPVDNAVAALRYIMERYKTPFNIPNLFGGNYIGYQNGTDSVPETQVAKVGEQGEEYRILNKGDGIITHERTSVLDKLADTLISKGDLSNFIDYSKLGFNMPNINIPSNINVTLDKLKGLKDKTNIHIDKLVLSKVPDVDRMVSELEQIVQTTE